jgi:phage shock protein C
MYCNYCGKGIPDDAHVCPYCAKQVNYVVPPRRLMRPRTNRKIAGVCAGFANYFDIDPVIVRLVWLVVVIFGGTGLLAYLIAWILMPEEPEALPTVSTAAHS